MWLCCFLQTRHLYPHREDSCTQERRGEDTSIFGLVVGNVACAAVPGAGCGLSKPITSLPLPSAWGSLNLSQVSPWLPPIQQWLRMGMGRNTERVNCPPRPKTAAPGCRLSSPTTLQGWVWKLEKESREAPATSIRTGSSQKLDSCCPATKSASLAISEENPCVH